MSKEATARVEGRSVGTTTSLAEFVQQAKVRARGREMAKGLLEKLKDDLSAKGAGEKRSSK